MTCAKQTVIAVLRSPTGKWFVGTNWCHNPRVTCPRAGMESGEGYDICKHVCEQSGHAETNVLHAAQDEANGSEVVIIGHDRICRHCKKAMEAAGVAKYRIITEDKG